MLPVTTLRRFEDLIRARAGLNMREQEAAVLTKVLLTRCQAVRISDPDTYLGVLALDSDVAQREWKQLFVLLTNQESYFFRDLDQLNVIRAHILPQLLQSNREKRTLRIWSAGCSTGEEPYSLAMMLSDVLELQNWRVTILGTDLSEAALERARRGLYGSWSFRVLTEDQKRRFFVPRGKEWEVAPILRKNVVFALNNLFGDEYPSPHNEIHEMDLIVCRNVFIYFGREAIAQVLKKFSATLNPTGFLVCGHAELHDVPLGDFKVQMFPQSLIYRLNNGDCSAPPTIDPKPAARPVSAPIQHRLLPQTTVPTVKASRPVFAVKTEAEKTKIQESPKAASDDVLKGAISQIRAGNYGAALRSLESWIDHSPDDLGALCLLAQAEANAGRLDAAEASCQRILKLAPFTALPYHLRARIAEERGDSENAKLLLKKVMYLNPASVWAALELGAIYRREGDRARATQMHRVALELISDLNDEASVPTEEYAVEAPLLVGDLKRQLQGEAHFSG